MKNVQRKMALFLAAVLLAVNTAGCTKEELNEYLQQGLEWVESVSDPSQQSQESEQVSDYPNQKKAQSRQAERETVKPPEQISVGKYAYGQLGETEQRVYDEILSTILNQEQAIKLSTTDTELMRRAYAAVCSDYGGLFWIEGYAFTRYTRGEELVSLEFSPKYTMGMEERRQIQEQIDEIVEAWFAGISINDTDYDKAKYVYELLALNTEYVENAQDSQNIISVFIHQKTVCQGYACAVQYLLEQLGIQSVIVSGMALGEPHAWNLICLDGEYYYMDATWGNNGYRNKEGKETPFIDYNYMAMTTAEMQLGHMPDSEQNLPECTSVVNNYYRKEGNYIETWEPDVIGSKLVEAWEAQQVITLRFSDNALRKRAFRYFIKEGHIADYCYGLSQINYIEDPSWKEISFCFNQS